MNKLIVGFITLFISLNLQGQSFDNIDGLYIGERHGNPVKAQAFIDEHKRGIQREEGWCPLGCTKKKERGYYVIQNNEGVHIWVIEKSTWFSSMPLNEKGEFSGQYNKSTLSGYFDGDILYAKLNWRDTQEHYLVGVLSKRDIDLKESLRGYDGAQASIKVLEDQIEINKEEFLIYEEQIIQMEIEHQIALDEKDK